MRIQKRTRLHSDNLSRPGVVCTSDTLNMAGCRLDASGFQPKHKTNVISAINAVTSRRFAMVTSYMGIRSCRPHLKLDTMQTMSIRNK